MILLFIAGLLSGAISGMGIGGGVVLIPVLTSFFALGQRNAQYINLLYFIPVASCAVFIHAKNKSLSYKVAVYMIIGGVAGALVGSALAVKMSVSILRKLFGGFLFAVGISQFFTGNKK